MAVVQLLEEIKVYSCQLDINIELIKKCLNYFSPNIHSYIKTFRTSYINWISSICSKASSSNH